MKTKSFKKTALFMCFLMLLCSLMCINCFATGEDLTEPVTEPETQQQEEPQPTETQQEQPTEITFAFEVIESDTEPAPKPTETQKPTQAPTKPASEPIETQKPDTEPAVSITKKPVDPDNGQSQNSKPVNNGTQNGEWNSNDDNTDKKTTEVSTTAVEGTTQSLTNADGSFRTYIEPNNGQRRFWHDLNAPDLLPTPDDPYRKGFDFVGWFADPEFKKEWDFDTDIAQPGCVLYAKWEDDGTDKTVYSITVSKTTGGKIEVNPTKAQPGETINITVTPNEGMRLKKDGLKINGKSTDIFSFKMTSGNVKVSAEFEAVSGQNQAAKKTNVTVIVLAVILVLVLAFAVFMFMRKRVAAVDDDDEDGDSWVDETLVVEDGFKDGDMVVKSEDDEDEGVELVSLDDISTDASADQTVTEKNDGVEGE